MESSKYPRTYHFPFSPGTTSDDRINKEWQSILKHELVLTEKLDGENNCLNTEGVFARSHAAPTRNPWAINMWELWEQNKRHLGDFHVFGENLYGLHSIEYTELEAYFYVFGIREGSRWLAWDEVEFYAKALDLPTVPVISRGFFTEKDIKKAIENTIQAGSRLSGECEGVVCRTVNAFETADFSQNVLKYVRKNHVQTDEHWTRNWQRAQLRFERSVEK